MAGSGSQTHTSGRWGDYSALLVDPSDGCTFWYTSQYYAVTSEMSWRTRIGSFAFPSCTSASGLPVVTVTATTAAVSEAGPSAGRFTFSRTGNTTASLTVRYTVNGTATADADYAALPETVTIPAGSLAATLDVTAIDDSFAEGSETVVLALDASESYAIGAPAGGIVTIASDDAPGDLVVSALTPPAVGGAGSTMLVTDVTRNQGAGVAEASSTGLYLSQSASLTGSAVLMGTRAVPSMAAAGADTASTSVTVPPGTATGVYYVIAKADVNAAVLEAQEGNNTRSALVRIGPDLVVAALAVPSKAAAGCGDRRVRHHDEHRGRQCRRIGDALLPFDQCELRSGRRIARQPNGRAAGRRSVDRLVVVVPDDSRQHARRHVLRRCDGRRG